MMTEIWIALVLTWMPVERVIDKEFNTEKECWDYYETIISEGTTYAEGKWGKQNLDHQGRRPDMNFHFKTNWNYPIRTYKGLGESPRGKDQVRLSCEPKYPNIYNK